MSVIVDLLREGVGQPRETAHSHPHRQILALDVTGRDVLPVGVPLTGIGVAPVHFAGL
jgi:hypothetical protein